MMSRLVLASGSPRRQDLLTAAGFVFDVDPPEVAEVAEPNESPEAMVVRLAREKATVVAERRDAGECVLACDTTVVLNGVVVGKPVDADDAVATLRSIGGRSHVVVSGYALMLAGGTTITADTHRSVVQMHPISHADAVAYVATGEPMDKAGSYGIQGIGRQFVAEYQGSFSNIMGLPMEAVVPALAAFGVVPRSPSGGSG